MSTTPWNIVRNFYVILNTGFVVKEEVSKGFNISQELKLRTEAKLETAQILVD